MVSRDLRVVGRGSRVELVPGYGKMSSRVVLSRVAFGPSIL